MLATWLGSLFKSCIVWKHVPLIINIYHYIIKKIIKIFIVSFHSMVIIIIILVENIHNFTQDLLKVL